MGILGVADMPVVAHWKEISTIPIGHKLGQMMKFVLVESYPVICTKCTSLGHALRTHRFSTSNSPPSSLSTPVPI